MEEEETEEEEGRRGQGKEREWVWGGSEKKRPHFFVETRLHHRTEA